MSERIKKILGWIIVVGIGLPSLIAAIWATGTARGVLSTGVLRTIPQQILIKVPDLAYVALNEAQKPGAVQDVNTATWLKAAGTTDMDIRNVFEDSGMADWLENDVGEVVTHLEPMLRGERQIENIELNLIPFKEAITSPVVENYVKQVVAQLPACSQEQKTVWIEEFSKAEDKNLPACNPGIEMVDSIWSGVVAEVNKIPDRGPIGDENRPAEPVRANILGTVENWLWSLFLFPLVFIGLGVWLMSNDKGQRLRDGGLIAAGGGLFGLMSVALAKSASQTALAGAQWGINYGQQAPFSTEYYGALAKELGAVVSPVLQNIFNPVINLAIIILVLGIGMAVAGNDLQRAIVKPEVKAK